MIDTFKKNTYVIWGTEVLRRNLLILSHIKIDYFIESEPRKKFLKNLSFKS